MKTLVDGNKVDILNLVHIRLHLRVLFGLLSGYDPDWGVI